MVMASFGSEYVEAVFGYEHMSEFIEITQEDFLPWFVEKSLVRQVKHFRNKERKKRARKRVRANREKEFQ